jgi:DnaK suppressor protein
MPGIFHLKYCCHGNAGKHRQQVMVAIDHRAPLMDKAKIAKFEDILTKKRDDLNRSLSRTQEDRQETDFGRDEADRATASMSREMTFQQKAQGRGLLMLVDAALVRIRSGTFGECLNCGQEISANRLTAVPWSRYCITCQELIVEQQQ